MKLPLFSFFLQPGRSKGKGVSKEKMAEIQSQIEADRRKLEKSKDMAEEEKRKVEDNLAEKEMELQKAGYVYYIKSSIEC